MVSAGGGYLQGPLGSLLALHVGKVRPGGHRLRRGPGEGGGEGGLSGEVGAAVLYTSMVTLAKMTNPDLKVVFPEEGIGFGVMAQFIPSDAPNAENAYKFIDYILQPEVSAQCFEYLGYYCTNKDAEQYISEEYREFLTLPEGIDMENMEMIENISAEAVEVHNRVYTEFKSACGQ